MGPVALRQWEVNKRRLLSLQPQMAAWDEEITHRAAQSPGQLAQRGERNVLILVFDPGTAW
jgi:hypothetical protein